MAEEEVVGVVAVVRGVAGEGVASHGLSSNDQRLTPHSEGRVSTTNRPSQ